jgi:hypothetical protein
MFSDHSAHGHLGASRFTSRSGAVPLMYNQAKPLHEIAELPAAAPFAVS